MLSYKVIFPRVGACTMHLRLLTLAVSLRMSLRFAPAQALSDQGIILSPSSLLKMKYNENRPYKMEEILDEKVNIYIDSMLVYL